MMLPDADTIVSALLQADPDWQRQMAESEARVASGDLGEPMTGDELREAATLKTWPPCHCGRGPVTHEIEGRVRVCTECFNDEDLREHARKDWR